MNKSSSIFWGPHHRGFAEYWLSKIRSDDPEIFNSLAFLLYLQDQGHIGVPQKQIPSLWEKFLEEQKESTSKENYEPSPDISKLPKQLLGDTQTHPIRLVSGKSDNWFYLQRMFNLEHRVAHNLARRLYNPCPSNNFQININAPGWQKLNTRQRFSVSLSINKKIFILSGGPGTGKTFSLFHILLQYFHQDPNLRVALAAPTGRAAARMETSLSNALKQLETVPQDWSIQVQKINKIKSQTIHRLLGLNPKHKNFISKKDPLPYDLIVLDESSMIELSIMDQLLERIPLNSKLILIGDKNQLPSVETGAVLGDLSQIDSPQHIGFLTENHRIKGSKNSASLDLIFKEVIGYVAPAPIEGEIFTSGTIQSPESIMNRWKNETIPGFKFYSDLNFFNILQELKKSSGIFDQEIQKKCINPKIDDFFILLKKLDESIILSVLRNGIWGSEGLNRRIQEALGRHQIGPGMPWMVTKNLNDWKIFNGDRGLIILWEKQLCVLFPASGLEGPRVLPLALLRSHGEVSYAMTVHKSQGSEFETVVFIIPENCGSLASKEIIYTGLTRAKNSVVLCGSEISIIKCLSTNIQRFSRIKELIEREITQP